MFDMFAISVSDRAPEQKSLYALVISLEKEFSMLSSCH